MSDQFKRQKITNEIARIKSQAEQAQKEVAEMRRIFNEAYARVVEERDRLRQELEYIANAKHKNFPDAEEFRAWAQNRARHAIGWKPGELTIKK